MSLFAVSICSFDGINLFGEQGKIFGFIGLLRLQRGDFVFEVGLFVGELGLLGFHIGYGIVGVAERRAAQSSRAESTAAVMRFLFLENSFNGKTSFQQLNFDFHKRAYEPPFYIRDYST